MRRRDFVRAAAVSVVTWPLTARAQQSDRMRLIGLLMAYSESDSVAQSYVAALRDTLTMLGWTVGSNLRIEIRWGAGDADRMKTFAKELVDLRPDAIVGQGTPVIRALVGETRTIPIVFVLVTDPIGDGFATSLTHPGGNITGFTANDSGLGGKWVGLLKEIAPRTERVALLFNPATSVPLQFFMASIQAAATSFAVQVSAAPIHAKDEIEGVVAAQASHPGGGLIVTPDAFSVVNRDLIIALAARYRVSTIYFDSVFAKSGGLISYGDNRAEAFRLAGGYVDRILKGDKPVDLPIQNPTKFEFVINLKTAKALGITLSSGLLSIADEVIE
jgi:putative tryptophan/tyrosine transport system substrate-binding protein